MDGLVIIRPFRLGGYVKDSNLILADLRSSLLADIFELTAFQNLLSILNFIFLVIHCFGDGRLTQTHSWADFFVDDRSVVVSVTLRGLVLPRHPTFAIFAEQIWFQFD